MIRLERLLKLYQEDIKERGLTLASKMLDDAIEMVQEDNKDIASGKGLSKKSDFR